MDQLALIALVDRLRAHRREASTIELKSNWDQPSCLRCLIPPKRHTKYAIFCKPCDATI